MAKLEFDIRKFCPALGQKDSTKEYSGSSFMTSLNTKTDSDDSGICPVGGKSVSVEVVGDRMTQEYGSVEISCEGCKLVPNGFTKTTKRKIA